MYINLNSMNVSVKDTFNLITLSYQINMFVCFCINTLIFREHSLDDLSFRKRFNFISCTFTREGCMFEYTLTGITSFKNDAHIKLSFYFLST